MDNKDREIPEELFQKDFGGGEIKPLMKERARQQSSEKALWVMIAM